MVTFFPVERVSLLLILGFRGGLLGVLTLFTLWEWSAVLSSSCLTVTKLFICMLPLIFSSDPLGGEDVVLLLWGRVLRYYIFSCVEINDLQFMGCGRDQIRGKTKIVVAVLGLKLCLS